LLGRPFGVYDHIGIWISILNTIFTIGGGLIFTHLLVRISKNNIHPTLQLVFLASYVAVMLPSSIGLMETSFALLWVGLAFTLLVKENRFSYTIFVAVIFLRLELALVYGLVVIYSLISQDKLQHLISFSFFGLIPFLIFDLYFFQSLIPQAISAKSVVYETSILSVARDIVCTTMGCNRVWELTDTFGISRTTILIFDVLVLSALLSVIVISIFKKFKELRIVTINSITVSPLIIFVWGIALVFVHLIAKTYIFSFPWYVPLYVVPLQISLFLIWDQYKTKLWKAIILSISFPFIMFNLISLPFSISGSIFTPRYYEEFVSGARVRAYIQIAELLEMFYPQSRMMTSEIGGLGYGFDGYIWDGAGLATPEALKYHPMEIPLERSGGFIGAIPVQFIQDHSPEIIVSYDIFIEAFLSSEDLDNFVRVKCPLFLAVDLKEAGTSDLWGSKYLNVFLRKNFMDEVSMKSLSGEFSQIGCQVQADL
jgi:hypothetical protein